MAKAFDDEINERLRDLAREMVRTRFDGNQSQLAEYLGVSGGFVSDFLNKKRGAGLETLSGLGRFAPLELLDILGIQPGVIVTLVEGLANQLEDGLASLPDELRRAARAAVELTGCTPGEAGEAALAVFTEQGPRDGEEPDWWLLKIRAHLHARPKSGARRIGGLLLPGKSKA
jgi:predicted transcriptional regulator